MKAIWNILAVLAIVNILAIAGAVLWLKSSDRLSRERIAAVRERFIKTVAQEKDDKLAAERTAKQKEADAAAAEKMAIPPATAAEKIADQQLKDDQRLQMILRQQQIVENMNTSVMLQLARLEEREKKLDADRKAFAAERKKIAETEGDKQFQVALSTLEGQKPKDAQKVLKAMLDQKQSDQVVAYLAKMDEGNRSKVVAEFVKDSPDVAAELLERLRTRGIVVPPPGSLAQAPAYESTGSPAANSPVTDGGAKSAR
jgi:hypothetical protein